MGSVRRNDHELRGGVLAHLPADEGLRVHVTHTGQVEVALVGNPSLVLPADGEVPIEQSPRVRRPSSSAHLMFAPTRDLHVRTPAGTWTVDSPLAPSSGVLPESGVHGIGSTPATNQELVFPWRRESQSQRWSSMISSPSRLHSEEHFQTIASV